VQILALFRDYDMRWPHSTLKFLSWSEIFNVGFTVTAPSVRLSLSTCLRHFPAG